MEVIEASVAPHAAGSLVHLKRPCDPGSTLLLASPDWIGQPVELTPTRCAAAEPIAVVWSEAAELRGRVQIQRGEVRPSLGRLSVARCPSDPEERPASLGSYPALFSSAGEWSARVPAGCLDLQLMVPPFAPTRWSAVDARQGRIAHVRDVTLVRGGAVSAQVVAEESGHGIAGAVVHLVPEQQMGTAAEAVFRREAVPSEPWARTDPDGWIRFEIVPAGRFGLVALPLPGRERSAAFSSTFTVRPGEDVVVPPLELPRPASLWIEAAQPDAIGREGRLVADAVPLIDPQLARFMRRVELGTDGTGVLEDLVPGYWQVSLYWLDEGDAFSSLAEQELWLGPGASEKLSFEMTGALYKGRISWNGQPLAGRVLLIPESEGYPGAHPSAESDQEGLFSVVLAESGSFTVEIVTADLSFSSVVAGVSFTDPEALVEIKLPEGRIEGFVVDQAGEPVANAIVRAEGVRSDSGFVGRHPLSFAAKTDIGGGFVLEGLGPAEWTLLASAGDRESEPRLVTLGDDEVRPGLRLVVEEAQSVTIAVVSELGEPVRGAEGVLVLPFLTHGRFFRTDHQGLVEMRLPKVATVATALVAASGFSRNLLRVPLNARARIVLSRNSGRLELVPQAPWSAHDLSHLGLVAADGSGESIRTFASLGQHLTAAIPSPASLRPIVLPDLSPGIWRLVRFSGDYAELMGALQGGGLHIPALATFTIEPGATTRLQVDPLEPTANGASGSPR